jgi:hypothetical protein
VQDRITSPSEIVCVFITAVPITDSALLPYLTQTLDQGREGVTFEGRHPSVTRPRVKVLPRTHPPAPAPTHLDTQRAFGVRAWQGRV